MSNFTPDQLAFIREPGHCCAVAGPGSGKTTSLLAKVADLARHPANRIVAATFTSDAAAEMQHRLVRKLGKMPANVVIGTWHSLALHHRRTHGLAKRTLGPAHQSALLRRVIEARVPPQEVARALIEFESIKCSMDSDYATVAHEWFHAYETELATLGAIDLYDVMRDTARMMARKELPLFAATHLIIDETQDNDEVQFFLANLHAGAGITTTMVGDDDQAIYEWRHAKGFSGMEAFIKRHNARVVTMGDNFRSRGSIVACADELICHNKGFRLPKTFVPRRGAGGSVKILSTSSWASAASSMLESIKPLLTCVAEEGLVRYMVPTGSVAVLARNNYMLDSIEDALVIEGIKYLRSGRSIWASEPADLLMTVLATLVSNDPRGLDAAMHIGGLPDAVISKMNSQYRGRVGDFFDAGNSFDDLAPSLATQAQQISARLAGIKQKIQQRQFGSAIGTAAAFVRQAFDRPSPQNTRNCEHLRAVASGLISMRGPLLARLKQAQTAQSEQKPENSVILQTFHGSKGQEYANVFLLGVDQDIIPGKSERRAERRLLYVACTRAKDTLVITHTAGKDSEFLREITPP